MYRCGNEEWKIRNVFFSLLHTSNLDDTQNLKKHQVSTLSVFGMKVWNFYFLLHTPKLGSILNLQRNLVNTKSKVSLE